MCTSIGAIDIISVLIWRARAERIYPLVLIDAGVLFAAAGRILGRIGNLINGDIMGTVAHSPGLPSNSIPVVGLARLQRSVMCPYNLPLAMNC